MRRRALIIREPVVLVTLTQRPAGLEKGNGFTVPHSEQGLCVWVKYTQLPSVGGCVFKITMIPTGLVARCLPIGVSGERRGLQSLLCVGGVWYLLLHAVSARRSQVLQRKLPLY